MSERAERKKPPPAEEERDPVLADLIWLQETREKRLAEARRRP
ncbi:hypothetical protein ACFWHG_19035 [Streptomyces microflavus]